MAFDSTKLSPASIGAPPGAPRLWVYDGTAATGSNDAGSVITAVNYFRAAATTNSGGPRPGDFVFYRGNDNANGIVTFATISTIASTGLKVSSAALA